MITKKQLKAVSFSDNKKKHNELLKIIAVFCIFINYLGTFLFPNIKILSLIGTLAFPIFAYQLGEGYVHTSNYRKYLFRLWIFAIISEIPYSLAYDTFQLNILFSFVIALFFIDKLAKKEYYWIFPVMALPIFIHLEYSLYGVFLPVSFYLFRNKRFMRLLIPSLIVIIFVVITHSWINLFSILGIIMALYFPKDVVTIRVNKYVFYWLYPISLLIIFIIKMVLVSKG